MPRNQTVTSQAFNASIIVAAAELDELLRNPQINDFATRHFRTKLNDLDNQIWEVLDALLELLTEHGIKPPRQA